MTSTSQGVLYALATYIMWGLAPIYFKAISSVAPYAIVSHRIIWSCVFLAGLLLLTKQWRSVSGIIKQPKLLAWLVLCAGLIAVNWLIFIWAVAHNKMLDASLGYYINPLFNIVLAMLFLGERFRLSQWLAIALATTGVGILVLHHGSLPWVALSLAVTFGFYGLIRKKIAISALPGLFLETLILLPVAAIYLFYFAENPTQNWQGSQHALIVLLISAGIITTLPLLCFTGATSRLRLSTVGFFQYIGPTLMFGLAVGIYGEPLDTIKLITFGIIWLALVVFSIDAWRHRSQTASKRA